MRYIPRLFYARPYWYLVIVERNVSNSATAHAYAFCGNEFYLLSDGKPEMGVTGTGALTAMVARCKAGEFRDEIRDQIM
jgi:hypothetical protein